MQDTPKIDLCYAQTKVAQRLLNPAFNRYLGELGGKGKNHLDVGCGQGVLYPISNQLGFDYTGVDISSRQIEVAMRKFPKAKFVLGDARSFKIDYKFDAVTISMFFPLMNSLGGIEAVLDNCRNHMTSESMLLVGVTHPCFDHYMRHGVLGLKNVSTQFEGYFASGSEFKFDNPTLNGQFTFDDFHWTISDYFNSITSKGFNVRNIDECKPPEEFRSDSSFWKRRNDYPTFLLFQCYRAK